MIKLGNKYFKEINKAEVCVHISESYSSCFVQLTSIWYDIEINGTSLGVHYTSYGEAQKELDNMMEKIK